jgi:tRNA(Ile)-lysidine synthase
MIKSIQFIDKYLSDSDAPIVVGVSGGPDSLVLLHLLHAAGKNLIVGYLDHGLRDPSTDLQVVSSAAASINAEFCQGYVNVTERSAQAGQTVEEAGREARYKFLFDLAEERDAQAVAVGHTADDQVETVLMHLLRGAGPEGLRGMQSYSLPNPWSSKIPLVRPLLAIWRTEIMAYIEAKQLSPSEDQTNLDMTYYRNRIRHELLPGLASYNPQIKVTLWKTAEILKDDYKLLEQSFQNAWQQVVLDPFPEQHHLVRYVREIFLKFSPSEQRAVLRVGIQKLRSNLRDIKFEWIEAARDFIENSGHSNRISLGASLVLFRIGNQIWLFSDKHDFSIPDWPLLEPDAKLVVDIPARVPFPGGWLLEIRWSTAAEIHMDVIQANQDYYKAWLQPDAPCSQLTIRTRKPGDRITPLGMAGNSIKLSDFMINVQLPQPVRARWPLVCVGEKIVWVPGYCIDDVFRVKNKSAPVLCLSLKHAAQLEQT